MSKTYRTLIEIDTKDASKSLNSLKQNVTDLNEGLDKLDQTTTEYTNKARQAQIATSNLDNAMEQIVIDGEMVGEKMGHVARIGAGLAGGFELVAGAMALSGKESEKFEEAMRRVAGAMAITNALSAMGDAFESIAKISPKAAIAIEKFGKAVGGALKGIPGIVLAAATAIGALFIKIRKDSKQTERYIEGVRDELAELVTDEEKEHTLHLTMLKTLQSNQPELLRYFDKNREAIEKVAGAHDDYNETIQAYIDKTPEYIDMIHKRAAAEKLMDDIVEHEIKIARLRKEKEAAEKEAAEKRGTGLYISNPAGGAPINTGGSGADLEAWKIGNELGKTNNELTLLKDLLNDTTTALIPLEQQFNKTTSSSEEETDELKKKRIEYKSLQLQLQEFSATVSKLNTLPINPQLEQLLTPGSSDIQAMKERNQMMLDLESTVIRLQDEATSINFLNRFGDARKESADTLKRLLRGESAETDDLATKRDELSGKKADLITEQNTFDKDTAEYQAYADKIKAIDDELAANLEQTRDKFESNRKEGIQSVEDMATMSADVISGLLGSVASNLEEGSAEFKAIKTAETIISTLTGSMKAYESLASIPYVGPVLGAAAAASVIATGASTISQIHATTPDSGVSLNSASTQLASITPTVQTHSAGGDVTTHQAEDTKVYVLESDIRKTSNKVRVAESEARF